MKAALKIFGNALLLAFAFWCFVSGLLTMGIAVSCVARVAVCSLDPAGGE